MGTYTESLLPDKKQIAKAPAMEILAALFLLWIFVTLIGHASYVVVRTLFRAITGDQRAVTRVPSPESDILAAERVIAEMAERGLLTKTETEKLRRS